MSRPPAGPSLTTLTLGRIRSLAIPPAWTEVWIACEPKAHLQATGRDARGRKQYRYHPRWREARHQTKYDRLVPFARTLPELRRRIESDLRVPALTKHKVVAAVVQLLGADAHSHWQRRVRACQQLVRLDDAPRWPRADPRRRAAFRVSRQERRAPIGEVRGCAPGENRQALPGAPWSNALPVRRRRQATARRLVGGCQRVSARRDRCGVYCKGFPNLGRHSARGHGAAR